MMTTSLSSRKDRTRRRRSLVLENPCFPRLPLMGGKTTKILIYLCTQRVLHPLHPKTKAFDFEKARNLGKEVHAQATDQRALPLDMAEGIIRVAGHGFTKFISAEELDCNIGLVLERNQTTLRRGWGLEIDNRCDDSKAKG